MVRYAHNSALLYRLWDRHIGGGIIPLAMVRKFLIELIVVGIVVGWVVARFPDALTPWIPWLCMAVLWHLAWEIAKGHGVKGAIIRALRGKSMVTQYAVAFVAGGLLSAMCLWGINAMLRQVAQGEQFLEAEKPASQPSAHVPASGQSPPAEQSKRAELTPPRLSNVPAEPSHSETGGPIENLARLGWNIKTDDKGALIFEIVAKPLPNMKESAVYFRVLQKQFQFNLQQVSSINGLALLSGVNNCVRLEIGASDIEDTAELRGLTSLRTLVISQTPFTVRHELNIGALASLVELESLSLNMSRVTNIEPLRKLTKLTSLSIGGSLVRDLSPIERLTGLKSLDVRDSGVTDMSAIGGDDSLEELSVDQKQVPSLVHLSRLTKLNKLTIIAQVPVEMAAVGTLSNLRSLFIWGPPLIDLSPLRKLGKLANLQVSGLGFTAGRSVVSDVDAIGELVQLRTLTLAQLQIDSLRFLAQLNGLAELNLNGLPIGSMPELAHLTFLKRISLVDVPVVDITPLLSLSNLEQVTLLRTPARADVISELERRGVKVTIH